MFKLNRSERGQSIIVIALIVVVLIALIALVIDIGWAYAWRRNCQNVADAASMAGTLEWSRTLTWYSLDCDTNYVAKICGKRPKNTLVRQVVRYYVVDRYGLDTDDIVAIEYVLKDGQKIPVHENSMLPPNPFIGVDVTGVQVTVGKEFDTFFAGVIGHGLLQASAVARAQVECDLKEGKLKLFPIAIDEDLFKHDEDGNHHPDWPPVPEFGGQEYCLWQGPHADPEGECDGAIAIPKPEKGADKTAPGNWGWLTWDGTNDVANRKKEGSLAYNIINGYEGWWEKGIWIPGNTGINAGAKDEMQDQIATGETVVIPVYDYLNDKGGNNAEYHTIKLVVFYITYAKLTGSEGIIKGMFVEELKDVSGGQGSDDCGAGLLWVRPARPE